MNNKLSWALVSLRISAILYYLMIVGFVMFAASLDLAEAWPMYFIAAFIKINMSKQISIGGELFTGE